MSTTFAKTQVTEEIQNDHRTPLELRGVLDSYQSFDLTPIIGREFVDVNLKDWLRASNSDELIRELAITVSQRGVVFFRKQDDLDNNFQKELAQRLGELSGKPKTSKLHIHPISNSGRRLGGADDEISVISSVQSRELYKSRALDWAGKKQSAKGSWHSDIAFEPIPSDYAVLKLTQLPKTGGDTLWASGYELYDRLSPPFQKLFEALSATYGQPGFPLAAKENNFELYSKPRGAPENVGTDLTAVHPCVRTNPVTGWKSLFGAGHHVQWINGLAEEESRDQLDRLGRLITENHDLQVRHRWQNVNDLAIWDNRCTFHTATYDYDGFGSRMGQRAVSLGERPYFDPESKSRRKALSLIKA
ncbi:MAG: hypothetical protein M1822_002832 [Bathelium mastoideum]|nr:MAG: hypothetical protein M1822_002832 [Bathelium mastoideum]